MEFSREQYLELMTFGQVDRPMFVELFGPLIGLEEEWRAQGASQEEIDMVAFDWDYVPVIDAGVNTGFRGGEKEVILEEDDEYQVKRDAMGRTMKLPKGKATIPLPLDYPVKDMDSWLRYKPMYTFCEERINWQAVEKAKKAQEQGHLVVAHIPGGYDAPRQLMGDEVTCLAYFEQPEVMQDMLATMTDTALRVFERLTEVLVPDQLSVHEDLAGKSGPLVGPRQIEEHMKPYFCRVWDLLSSKGTGLFQMDTDGNVETVIDAFLDCGLTCIYPMEPAAGMDVVELRRKYGKRLAMSGGIDKFAIGRGKEAIRAELEYKMQPLMREGGMVFGLDHRIPNGTPLENYRYYVDLGREILGLPPREEGKIGWRRMAF